MTRRARLTTTMFEIIRGRGMTIEGFCLVGEGKYTPQYLRSIKASIRAVPDSEDFQRWVAETLHLPVSALFFAPEFAGANSEDTTAKAEVA